MNAVKIGTGRYHSGVKNDAGNVFVFGCNNYNECCLMNFEGKYDQKKIVLPNNVDDFINQQIKLKGVNILDFKLGYECTLLWFEERMFFFLYSFFLK